MYLDLFGEEDEQDAPILCEESMEPLTLLLQRAINLKSFTIDYFYNMEIFDDTPLEKLEFLEIRNCGDANIVSLPRSLVHLKMGECCFASINGFTEILTTNSLPRLKLLEMYNMLICFPVDDFVWTESIQRLNLPIIESISLLDCEEFFNNDVFLIAEAARNLPNSKEYKVQKNQYVHDVVEPDVLRTFCTSSLAANLEVLELQRTNLGDKGLEILVKNAPNFQRLEKLEVCIGHVDKIEKITQSGARGGWPMLRELKLLLRYEDHQSIQFRHTKECLQFCNEYCMKLLGIQSASPNLHLSVEFLDESSM